MNPGKIIVVVLSLFAVLMFGFFAYVRLHGDEQIPDNYYAKGNAFQTDLDARNNAEKDNYFPKIEINSSRKIEISFADSALPDSIQTEAWQETQPNVKITKFEKFEGGYVSNSTVAENGYWVINCNYFKNKKMYQANLKKFVK